MVAKKGARGRTIVAQMARRGLKGIQGVLDRYRWWEFQFLAIGIISSIGILVVLFLPLGSGPPQIRPSTEMPAAGTPAFVRQLANTLNLPVEQAPHIDTFNNG